MHLSRDIEKRAEWIVLNFFGGDTNFSHFNISFSRFHGFFGAVYSKHDCQELSFGGKGNSRDKKF